jgi:DNA-directed RNA polymerase I, II, and III subunit RPABC2
MSVNGSETSSSSDEDDAVSVLSETPSELQKHDIDDIEDLENQVLSSDDENSVSEIQNIIKASGGGGGGTGLELPSIQMEDVASLLDTKEGASLLGGGGACKKSGQYVAGGNGNRFLLDEDDIITTNEKFDPISTKTYVDQYHPECIYHNNGEIERLCIRKPVGEDDPLHRTTPILSKYERARVLGKRAKQLNAGAKSNGVIGEMDGYIIAVNELESRRLPFIIRRPLPNNTFEYWKLSDLENIHF